MIVFSLLGIILIIWTLVEIGMTTLTAQSAGPLTSRVMRLVWKACLKTFAEHPRRHSIFAMVGPTLLALTAVVWDFGIWIGWWLVFLGSGDSIVNSTTNQPASALETLYFAGYTVTTLGLGDFKPSGGLWQILTAICAASGLLALTVSVTYLVAILSAAVQKRQLALTIHGLGSTPCGILTTTWNGKDFSDLDALLPDMSSQIIMLGQQHMAYPALHYFHSIDAAAALPVRLAAFSEAIDAIATAVPDNVGPSQLALIQCQRAIRTFLASMRTAHIDISENQPSFPDLAPAAMQGVPVDLSELGARNAGRRDRRLLFSLVVSDGWEWSDLERVPDDELSDDEEEIARAV